MGDKLLPVATSGLQQFPALIRQLGQSYLVRDVMTPRIKIIYVKPGDSAAAEKIVLRENFSVVPCSADGEGFPAVYETTRAAGSRRVVVEEREAMIADFIPDGTPLAEALGLFQLREWYFTLRGNRVAGLITYWDFNSHEFHVQLYAALSRLEEIFRDILALDGCGLQDSHGLLLSEETLAKVRARFESSRKDMGGNRFVDELDFHDVQTALKKHPPWREYLHSQIGKKLSNHEYDGFFTFTRLRNAVMHGRVLFPTYRDFLPALAQVGNIVDLFGYIRAYCSAAEEEAGQTHVSTP